MRELDERFYEQAGEELVTKQVRLGVWAKAFARADGDEARTKAIYIELRVLQLREQLVAEVNRRSESVEQKRKLRDDLIRERLGNVCRLPYRDDESKSNACFEGHPDMLVDPISASVVADVLGVRETDVIIAIRSGYVKGTRHAGDWFVDLSAGTKADS